MQTPEKIDIQALIARVRDLQAPEALKYLAGKFSAPLFSTSFSIEDQMITHIIQEQNLPVRIFTLDTGRHFSETYKVWDATRLKYKIHIESFAPEAADIENLLRDKGPYSFYDSVDNRKECCHLRKVKPLGRALIGADLWITGIRADHSVTRTGLDPLEYDSVNNIIKFHPLLNYSEEQVMSYIKENKVPYNKLYDKGFLSIGCEPCTRPVEKGESIRSGRWWWENPESKECGLHVSK